MVRASAENAEVAESLKGDSVFGSAKSGGSGVAGDLALSDVVGGLRTKKETITTENGVGSQSRTLTNNAELALAHIKGRVSVP